MLKSLYEHFKVLYEYICEKNPTLAAEHSLRQEEEVYNKSTKLTYRNVRPPRPLLTPYLLITYTGCHFLYSLSQATT
jgi:hypothetical protein